MKNSVLATSYEALREIREAIAHSQCTAWLPGHRRKIQTPGLIYKK